MTTRGLVLAGGGLAGETLAGFADDASLAAFGPNPLDPACRIPSAKADREQGRRESERVARFLSR